MYYTLQMNWTHILMGNYLRIDGNWFSVLESQRRENKNNMNAIRLTYSNSMTEVPLFMIDIQL